MFRRGKTMSLYGLARNWWWVVLRGLFAAVLVLVACFGTYNALVGLVLLFGAYALVDGIVVLIAGVTHSHGARPGWLLLLEVTLGIGAGTLAFLSPGLTGFGLLVLLVGWAIVTGVLEIAATIHLHGVVEKAVLLVLGLVVAATLAALQAMWPTLVSLAFLWLTAAYILIFSVLQVGLGLRVRDWQARWMRPLHLLPVAVNAGQASREPQAS
jgi:uncharacterized membrane protein HdeD (DUF308 family)